MASEVVPLLERLAADVAAQLVGVLATTLTGRVKVEVALVLRAHVVDEVGRHAEARVALGTPVLRQLQRRERRRQRGTAPARPGGRRRRPRSRHQLQQLFHHRVRRPVPAVQRQRRRWRRPTVARQIRSDAQRRSVEKLDVASGRVVVVARDGEVPGVGRLVDDLRAVECFRRCGVRRRDEAGGAQDHRGAQPLGREHEQAGRRCGAADVERFRGDRQRQQGRRHAGDVGRRRRRDGG